MSDHSRKKFGITTSVSPSNRNSRRVGNSTSHQQTTKNRIFPKDRISSAPHSTAGNRTRISDHSSTFDLGRNSTVKAGMKGSKNLKRRENSNAATQVIGATIDFARNFRDMRKDNTIGNDKYFHCKANCEASVRGEYGKATAEIISDARESTDDIINVYGDTKGEGSYRAGRAFREKDIAEDQYANEVGRNATSGQRCKQVCVQFRVNGMNKKY